MWFDIRTVDIASLSSVREAEGKTWYLVPEDELHKTNLVELLNMTLPWFPWRWRSRWLPHVLWFLFGTFFGVVSERLLPWV